MPHLALHASAAARTSAFVMSSFLVHSALFISSPVPCEMLYDSFKGNVGKPLLDMVEHIIMGFSEHVDTILN